MLKSHLILSVFTKFLVFQKNFQICSNWISWIVNDIFSVHLTPLTIRASSCKISRTSSCLSQLNTLNWLLSWTPLDCLAHTFQNHLVAAHTPCKTIFIIIFPLKKSLCANVTFLIGRSTKGMWVPSRFKSTYVWQTYQFSKFLNYHLDCFSFGMLILFYF